MPRERADREPVAGVADVRSSSSRPMSTSSAGRAKRSLISGSSEWPPASSFASSRAAEQLDRVVDRLGHARSRTRAGIIDRASWIARQTRSGVAGMSMSVTPYGCERVDAPR